MLNLGEGCNLKYLYILLLIVYIVKNTSYVLFIFMMVLPLELQL